MADISPKTIINLIKLGRPVHWVKNLGIFAAIVFSGGLFDFQKLEIVFWGFWAFNLAASSIYIINDIFDIKRDRAHPIKKNRPLASGKVSVPLAATVAVLLLLISLVWAEALSHFFFILLAIYIILQIFYSLFLKHIHIIDILVIASGFVIRVYSGAFLVDAHLSVWFLLCVISVALFLASGKRRAELGALGVEGETRKSLSQYSKEVLNSYVTMFGNAAWLSWALFTFYESPRVVTNLWIFLAELSNTASVNKLLMITIPFTIFGIMRYESLIFNERAEAPEKLLLTDKALIASVMIWVGLVIWILYGGVATYSSSV
jgi:4-hydroxybenzoate polyprenyltransferase